MAPCISLFTACALHPPPSPGGPVIFAYIEVTYWYFPPWKILSGLSILQATVLCFLLYLTDGYFAILYMGSQLQFQQNKMIAFLVPKALRILETFLQVGRGTYYCFVQVVQHKGHLLNSFWAEDLPEVFLYRGKLFFGRFFWRVITCRLKSKQFQIIPDGNLHHYPLHSSIQQR